MKELLILGNAKSLKDYEFYNYKIDTIGINIAYKFWHEIKWYPTYYVSLDKNVNMYYGKQIYDLIENKEKYGIKKFLLRKIFLKQYPKLINDKSVQFLEDINHPKNKGFTNDKQINSGIYCVRWGIYLGYKKIYLLGIDCCYLPINNIITNSKGILLNTPLNNLNYFFDGYQSRGDRLHITSNKAKKDGRKLNHLDGFRKINNEFNKVYMNKKTIKKSNISYKKTIIGKYVSKPKPMVVNSNIKSKLYSLKILPYEPFPVKFIKTSDLLNVSYQNVTDNIIKTYINIDVDNDKDANIAINSDTDKNINTNTNNINIVTARITNKNVNIAKKPKMKNKMSIKMKNKIVAKKPTKKIRKWKIVTKSKK